LNPFPIIAAALLFILGLASGYTWEHRAKVAEVSALKSDISKREAAAAEETRRRIETASHAADQALAERDARLTDLETTNRRLRNDIKTATTGRTCLSADARGLLQQSPAFGVKLPASSGSAATATAAAPTNTNDSTDTDVATWIVDAADLYEQCRARIDALREWDIHNQGDSKWQNQN
jgi:hypothetical protein